MDSTIPEGYMQNAAGHMVPEDQVRDQDKLRDQVVLDLATKAKLINEQLSKFKRLALEDIQALIETAAEKYEVQIGGKKGNVSLISYNGKYKVDRSVANVISFTEELEAAKALITECIDEWTQSSSKNVRALVDRAFKTNTKGQVKTAAVLDLLRLEIDDEKWQRAMQALKDSIQVNSTTTYIRIYERIGMSNQYAAIPLDIAAVRT
ncbi:DUF3164 family protein [Pseudomonas sp. HK3]